MNYPDTSLQTSRDLRRVNQRTLLNLIYFNEPISRLDLSDRSGLSPATVTNLVSHLLDEQVVIPTGLEESQGGRPRTTFAINPHYGYFVGVEVAETHIYTELYDMKLRGLANARIEISTDENQPESIVEFIAQGVKAVLAERNVPSEKVIATGIGMPGVVSRSGDVSVFAPNWGWHNVPLLDMLKAQLDLPIHLDNGAQAMALAEMWFGAGRGAKDLAVLLLGTGVGAGIITGGTLYRGATSSAGEWGHTCIELDGPPCRCGSQGCLETFAGAPGIIRQLREMDANHPLLKSQSQRAILEALHDAALGGDPVCSRVLDQVAHYLAVGIANLVNLFNPQLIVIGGWCGVLISDYVFPRLEAIVQQYALSEPLHAVKIATTHLGGEGVVGLGAASLALETFLMGRAP
jgi:glucokinase-like ROK family protein